MAQPSLGNIMEVVSRTVVRSSYLERLAYLRSQRIPRFLYKYRATPKNELSIRPVQGVIVDSKLWLSSPADFNDPFDASAKLIVDSTAKERWKRFDKVLKRQGMPWHERQRQLPGVVAKSMAELEKVAPIKFQEHMYGTGVISFAGNPLSILMWSHYGSNHEGVCFQFDVAKDPESFCFTLPVEYSDDYPIVNWVTDFDGFFEKTLLRKHIGWSYEGERRIIKLHTTREHYPFKPEALTAIIIGCRADPKAILSLVEERVSNGLPRPKLYGAAQHDRKYRLILKPL